MDNGRGDTLFGTPLYGPVVIGLLTIVGVGCYLIVRQRGTLLHESTEPLSTTNSEASSNTPARSSAGRISIADDDAQPGARRRRPRSATMAAAVAQHDGLRRRAPAARRVATIETANDRPRVALPPSSRYTHVWGVPLNPAMGNTRYTPLHMASPQSTVTSRPPTRSVPRPRQRRSPLPCPERAVVDQMLRDLVEKDEIHESEEQQPEHELAGYDQSESPLPMSDSDSGSETTLGNMPSAPNGGSLTLPVPSAPNGRALERGSGGTL